MLQSRSEKDLAWAVAEMDAQQLLISQRLASCDPDIREALYMTYQMAFRRGHGIAAPDTPVPLVDNPFSGPAIEAYVRRRRTLGASDNAS